MRESFNTSHAKLAKEQSRQEEPDKKLSVFALISSCGKIRPGIYLTNPKFLCSNKTKPTDRKIHNNKYTKQGDTTK
jgi:hypothetical protein